MYEEVRNYIWDFATVQRLADLEIAVFRRFPMLPEVRTHFNNFYLCIQNTCDEDEDLSQAVQDFKDIINSSDEVYSMIIQPKEA